MFFRGKSGGGVSWLLVCLGNPGIKYSRTRHNVGFHAADALEKRCGIRIDKLKCKALTGTAVLAGEKVLVMKPQTMMNLSGVAVQQAASFYKIPPEHIIVIYDDISLAVGRMRVRRSGSAGGHNGMKDIIARIGSDQFPRIKIGVGEKPNPEYDLASWVLGRPTQKEWETLEDVIQRALDAAECIVAEGTDKAMSSYNN